MKRLLLYLSLVFILIPSYSQWLYKDGWLWSSGSGIFGDTAIYHCCYNPVALELFERMDEEPPGALRNAISEFYDTIQRYHIDDTLDFLYNFAVHTSQAACLDWIRPAITATLVNSPVHTPYEGFLTNGTDNYIKANYCPAMDWVHYWANSASIGVYIRTNTIAADKVLIGAYDGSNYIHIYIDATNFIYKFNGIEADNIAHSDDISGFTIFTRQDATAGAYARNEADYTTLTNAVAGIPNEASGIFIGANNNNSAAANYTNNQFSFAFCGGQLTQTQATKLYEAMERFLDVWDNGVN